MASHFTDAQRAILAGGRDAAKKKHAERVAEVLRVHSARVKKIEGARSRSRSRSRSVPKKKAPASARARSRSRSRSKSQPRRKTPASARARSRSRSVSQPRKTQSQINGFTRAAERALALLTKEMLDKEAAKREEARKKRELANKEKKQKEEANKAKTWIKWHIGSAERYIVSTKQTGIAVAAPVSNATTAAATATAAVVAAATVVPDGTVNTVKIHKPNGEYVTDADLKKLGPDNWGTYEDLYAEVNVLIGDPNLKLFSGATELPKTGVIPDAIGNSAVLSVGAPLVEKVAVADLKDGVAAAAVAVAKADANPTQANVQNAATEVQNAANATAAAAENVKSPAAKATVQNAAAKVAVLAQKLDTAKKVPVTKQQIAAAEQRATQRRADYAAYGRNEFVFERRPIELCTTDICTVVAYDEKENPIKITYNRADPRFEALYASAAAKLKVKPADIKLYAVGYVGGKLLLDRKGSFDHERFERNNSGIDVEVKKSPT